MTAINLPFAAGAPRRVPTSDELANGYGCGDADLELFNYLAWLLSGLPAGVIEKSGLTSDDADLYRLARAVRRGALNYAVAGGTANALTVTLDPAPNVGEIAEGFRLWLKVATTNTGAATLGGDALTRPDGSAVVAGDLVAGRIIPLVRTATGWALAAWPSGVFIEKLPASRAFQTVAGSVTVEATSTSTVAQTTKGLAGQAANLQEWYTDTTIKASISPNGVMALSGSTPRVDFNNGSSTWSMNASANNFEFFKATTRIYALGQGIGVGNTYVAQLEANSFNGLSITQNNVASSFNSVAFYTTSGNLIGAIVTSPSPQTTSYNTTSDGRLKVVEGPLLDVGSIIDSLEPVLFRWVSQNGQGDVYRGFIAQDLHAVAPEAVTPGKGEPGDEDFLPWGVDPGKLIPLMVAELKALRARVAVLESQA